MTALPTTLISCIWPQEVLYCARKAGVTHVLKAGGAQAVAAMAWGTETCPKVGGSSTVHVPVFRHGKSAERHAVYNFGRGGAQMPLSSLALWLVGQSFMMCFPWLQVHKILGPGNQYVTAAKMLLQNSEAMVAIDMPAGPSEVLVIADAAADPAFIAADLLSQAEHGPDSQASLPTSARDDPQSLHSPTSHAWLQLSPDPDPNLGLLHLTPVHASADSTQPDAAQVVLVALPGVDIEAVEEQVQRQCDALPRADAARSALSHSCIVRVGGREEARISSLPCCRLMWFALCALGRMVMQRVFHLCCLANILISTSNAGCSLLQSVCAGAFDPQHGGRRGVAAVAQRCGIRVPRALVCTATLVFE